MDADTQFDAARLLNARFERLDSRLDALEAARAPRGNVLQSLASATALMISIATGGFTLYQNLVTAPAKELEEKVSLFRRTFAQANDIMAATQKEFAQAASPAAQSNIISASQQQIGPVLSTLKYLEPEVRERLNAEDYIMLGWVAGQVQDASAREFLRRGLERGPTPQQTAFVHWTFGMMDMSLGTPDAFVSARKEMEQAIATYESSGDPTGPGRAMDVRVSLVSLAMNDPKLCPELPEILRTTLAAGERIARNEVQRQYLYQRLGMAAASGTKCAFPPDALASLGVAPVQPPAVALAPPAPIAPPPAATP